MDFLLYFNSTAMVLGLFLAAATVVIWLAKKLWRATFRLVSRADDDHRKPAAKTGDQWDPNHPNHYKRAGQW
jgi:hypothetical protein